MCLDIGFRSDNRIGRGYKVFDSRAYKSSSSYEKAVQGCFFSGKTDVWLRDNPNNELQYCPRNTACGNSYPLGFHIFKTLRGAKKWASVRNVIYPVEYRHVLARGTQDCEPAVVALEVKINTEYGWEVHKDYDVDLNPKKITLKKFTD